MNKSLHNTPTIPEVSQTIFSKSTLNHNANIYRPISPVTQVKANRTQNFI